MEKPQRQERLPGKTSLRSVSQWVVISSLFCGLISGCLLFRGESGMKLKEILGFDYADPTITNPMILRSCNRLKELVASDKPVMEVDYMVWAPSRTLGFGEHASLMLQFGLDRERELFVIDIGRRPADINYKEISVLRIYDRDAFLKSVHNELIRSYSISWLCPNTEAKALASNVLGELKDYIEKPPHDPVAWNFNFIFHNCARYTQEVLGKVMTAPMKERVVNYRPEPQVITPVEFGDHLNVCNIFAMELAGKNVLAEAHNRDAVRVYLARQPDAEKEKWSSFLDRHLTLKRSGKMFREQLKTTGGR